MVFPVTSVSLASGWSWGAHSIPGAGLHSPEWIGSSWVFPESPSWCWEWERRQWKLTASHIRVEDDDMVHTCLPKYLRPCKSSGAWVPPQWWRLSFQHWVEWALETEWVICKVNSLTVWVCRLKLVSDLSTGVLMMETYHRRKRRGLGMSETLTCFCIIQKGVGPDTFLRIVWWM